VVVAAVACHFVVIPPGSAVDFTLLVLTHFSGQPQTTPILMFHGKSICQPPIPHIPFTIIELPVAHEFI
jgi:hypothetical protein